MKEYVGTYRVMAEYDRETNDWIRDEFGNIDSEFNDFYIPLKNNVGRILSYSDEVMIFHIVDNPEIYLKLKNIQKKNKVMGLSTLGGSSDGFIYFYKKDLDKYLEVVSPMTEFKNRDPFDYKNLPVPFKIPKKKLDEYETIANEIKKAGDFKLVDLLRKFIKINCATTLENFRKSGLTYVNFIYQNGNWNEFIDFLRKNS